MVLDPKVPEDFCSSLIGDVCARRIGCAGVLRDADCFDAGAGQKGGGQEVKVYEYEVLVGE